MSIPNFDASEIGQLLNFQPLVSHLEQALSDSVETPQRTIIKGCEGRELITMPVLSKGFGGVKILTVTPDNQQVGLPVIRGVFALFDAGTGATLATMDASELTARRTAAVSALASKRLVRRPATKLLIMGSGFLAPYLAEAHCSVHDITEVRIWARNSEKVRRCCEEIRSRLPGLAVGIADDRAQAVARADIVSAATRSEEPIISGAWVSPGAHIDLVGGYRPEMRELDDEGIRKGRIYVDDIDAVLAEAGDLRIPISRGVIDKSAILADLPRLARTKCSSSENDVTIFKSVGTAASDLAAASFAWRVYRLSQGASEH